MAEKVNRDGYEYTLDGRNGCVLVREVPPNGSRNVNSDFLTPHTEDGKREAGYRFEWLILAKPVLIALVVCGLLLAASVVLG